MNKCCRYKEKQKTVEGIRLNTYYKTAQDKKIGSGNKFNTCGIGKDLQIQDTK